MAKPKKDVVTKIEGSIIYLWANDLTTSDILSIEGIVKVLGSRELPWMIQVDARYDINELAEELEELLSAKVPGVFYDDSPD